MNKQHEAAGLSQPTLDLHVCTRPECRAKGATI
jgi:hypothetical protein